jgi:GntR family transcriptional regulator
MLENDCGLSLGCADLSINAIPARAPIARALEIKRDVPVLRVERLTYDSNDHPVDFEYLYFQGDTFQFRLRVNRERPAKGRRKA